MIKKKKEEEKRDCKRFKVWKLNLLMMVGLGKTLTLYNNDGCWS